MIGEAGFPAQRIVDEETATALALDLLHDEVGLVVGPHGEALVGPGLVANLHLEAVVETAEPRRESAPLSSAA